ncbi:unnamed protein product [Adineta ricciae]|uniref:MD-2-related lipid-recognition domain-containing protein n=1 Tax=Adineta ricciae TaxID=249248 RepID=A0A814VIB6_ADIRI|nr:unnamed protein product [Adineta ricciae]
MSSSSSYILFLNTLGNQIVIYLGIFVVVAGILGESLNIIVFLSLRTFRQNSCAFYLTIMSTVNICQLLSSLFNRIIPMKLDIDWSKTSAFYCKFRFYLYQVSAMTSLTLTSVTDSDSQGLSMCNDNDTIAQCPIESDISIMNNDENIPNLSSTTSTPGHKKFQILSYQTEAFHMHLLFMTVLLALNGANAFVNKQKELRVTAFSWQNCGPSSDPVQAKSLSVSPDPILVPGNLTLGLTVNVASTITNDTYAAVIVERKVGAIFVKVPCVDNLGSCTYEDACKDWASACPKYFEKYGIPCSCPIPPKTYTISDAVIDINGHLPSGGGGEYRITANLGSSKGHLGCIKVQITLKKD